MDLRTYLAEHAITLTGVLPLEQCCIKRPYLLERVGFSAEQALFVQIFAIPYLSPAADSAERNLSAYAVGEDYHLFVRMLFDTLLPRLHADFPNHHFAGFADHSPIDEIEAAVTVGLGVRGLNHLLLTERYSSYVFLAEIITDLPIDPTPTPMSPSPRQCHHCKRCLSACPMMRDGGECRSALTQKKGLLTDDERHMLTCFSSVWGCDICQEVCPYTAHARARGTIWSPIPFFNQNTLAHLSVSALDAMSDEQFERRAYAWRGRRTIRRNLLLHEMREKED